MTWKDIEKLHELSARHYPEFDCPDFHRGYFNTSVILNDNHEVIMGIGLRKLIEVVLVTDKEMNKITIGKALIKALGHSINTSRSEGIDFLHAFVKDPGYERHLIEHGFEIRDSKTLSLYVKEREK